MKTETKVILALLLGVLALELAARLFENVLSKDISHIRDLPRQAQVLASAPEGTLKVLILGNSLSRALQQATIKAALENQLGRKVEIAVMHPDASSIDIWYYGYRRYFNSDRDRGRPDLILLCTGRIHLLDSARSDTDTLAAFYTTFGDMLEMMRGRSLGPGDICSALFSRVSYLFAHRQRVQPLIFYNIMPDYELAVNQIQSHKRKMSESQAGDHSCRQFSKLLDTIAGSGGKLLILPVPMPKTYALPDCVVETAGAHAIAIIRPMKTLPAVRFPDNYHLDSEGADVWTHAVLSTPEWRQFVISFAPNASRSNAPPEKI